MVKILVVEDDEKLNKIVCSYLRDNNYTVTGCLNPREAYDVLYNTLYDMIISDVMLPEIDGIEFAKTIRELNKTIPILFMTARDDIMTKQRGFRAGIDDYMVKPIDLDELVLRVGALLRRASIAKERQVIAGDLVMDADAMTAAVKGEYVPVTVREFNILFKMISFPNHTFSRAQLMDEFWGIDSGASLGRWMCVLRNCGISSLIVRDLRSSQCTV